MLGRSHNRLVRQLASVFDADFSEVFAGRHVVKGNAQFLEGKRLTDNGANLVLSNCLGHLGEIITAAYGDSLQLNMSGHDLSQRHIQDSTR